MAKHLDVLNAEQWGDLYLELATDAQKKASGVTPELVRTWGKGTDWQDALFRTAITHQHQASVSGGSEKERFLISGNYLSQDGVIRGSDFSRLGSPRVPKRVHSLSVGSLTVSADCLS